jgi:hypothetical protein
LKVAITCQPYLILPPPHLHFFQGTDRSTAFQLKEIEFPS